jgi:hypothetical protein
MRLLKGVIENNNSPKKDGKVQVRVLGMHTKDNENSSEKFATVSTDDLPWADVLGTTSFGLISGVGVSSILPNGTWVWCIIDENPNIITVIGTIIGTHTKSSSGVYSGGSGFCDPDEEYPIEDRLNEPDINELVRGVIKNTVIGTIKNENLDDSDVYKEKKQSPSVYPNSTVFESKSGHILEFDDSEGKERVQIIDKNGNYFEMKMDEYIEKAVKDKIELVMGDMKQHIVGKLTSLIEGDIKQTFDGKLIQEITGTVSIKTSSTVKHEFGGKLSEKIAGDLESLVDGKLTLGAGDDNVPLGSKVAGIFQKIATWADSHMHIGNSGAPTSPSTMPLTPDIMDATMAMSGVYSQSVKIKK